MGFDVPAGNYAYGRLDGEPSGKATAFIAPAGRTVYLGDFIYTRKLKTPAGGGRCLNEAAWRTGAAVAQ
ncbi:hypothetical protein RBA41_00910 [Massilia sp. CCM 9210]|uniref:hypothetical protein n=1 Tax=Massilia scottii TaxID=3057166 RepID=UPI002796465D|nr:hypothetical protein [Massilia sp. CCM 9210]MDQ1811854.1 hypothetical protein [Massilia sp. CCM 9210]